MRVPTRKSEIERCLLAGQEDRHLTPEAITRLKLQLVRLKTKDQPEALVELQAAQQMGDLSENFGYQEAKARLRRINARILTLTERINRAIPIVSGPSADGCVRLGSTVVLETAGARCTYQILGPQEADPTHHRISQQSPLGVLLLGKKVGDTVSLKTKDRETIYKILDVK